MIRTLKPRNIFTLFTAQLFLCVGALRAESIKELVLDDCNGAKEALAHAAPSERSELVPYFAQVLQLTLTGLVPPSGQTMPQLPSKVHDNNPVPVNRVDPLRVVDDDRERSARRCAVDLLGMVQGGAVTALPELIRYASQHELDDASRDIADETIISIAERVGDQISDDVVSELAATLKGERPELARSVLLILAPHTAQQITTHVLSDADIPTAIKAEVLTDLARVDNPAVIRAFNAIFASVDAAAQSSAFDMRARLKWDIPEVTPRLAPMLFSENSEIKSNAARQLVSTLSVVCQPVDAALREKLIGLLASDDVVGEAALDLLRCLRQQSSELPFAMVRELAERDEPLVRSRAALLVPASTQASREEFDLLKKLLVDSEVIVQRAAIHALGDLKIEKRSEVSALLLRYAQKFEKKNPAPSIPQLADELARQIPKFTPLNTHSLWVSVAEDFFILEAANKGNATIGADEEKIALEILNAFSSDGIEIPLRLLKTGTEPQRLLGAELLVAFSTGTPNHVWPKQYIPVLEGLLGDDSEIVRTFAIRTIARESERYRAGLTAAALSKNLPERGAAALLLFQLNSASAGTRARKVISKIEMQSGHDWIGQAGCDELRAIISAEILQNSGFRNPTQARIVGCLASPNAANDSDLNAVFDALQDDRESTAMVVQAALDAKFNDATVVALLARGDDLGLPAEQIKPLVGTILRRGNGDLIQRVLPVVARLADQGAAFAPQLRHLADLPNQNGKLRCLLYGTLSSVAPSTVTWSDFFLAEIHASAEKDNGFFSCAGEIEPSVAQPALEDLLKQLPLHLRASVFERITSLSRVSADEPLTAAIDRSLAEPNQDLRCQAVRSAIRIGLSSAGIENAVRRGLYNECWNDLQTARGALIAQAAAAQILATPRNPLEEIRAALLQ